MPAGGVPPHVATPLPGLQHQLLARRKLFGAQGVLLRAETVDLAPPNRGAVIEQSLRPKPTLLNSTCREIYLFRLSKLE